MGLFSRQLAKAILPTGSTLAVQIWDEVLFARLKNGNHTFTLEREPANRADKNAIRVNCSLGWIGYLNSSDAKKYAKILDRIPVPVHVQARAKNGEAVIGIPRPVDLAAWVSSNRFAS